MSQYTCLFYTAASGRSPVVEFVNSLDEDTQDKFIFKKELLEEFGPKLRYPHTDDIGDDVLELRFKGREGQIRVLFFFYYQKKIIFTNGFIKKQQKTPQKEIRIAKQRMRNYLQRYGRK